MRYREKFKGKKINLLTSTEKQADFWWKLQSLPSRERGLKCFNGFP